MTRSQSGTRPAVSRRWWLFLLMGVGFSITLQLSAQEDTAPPAETVAVEGESDASAEAEAAESLEKLQQLPGTRELSAALSEPSSRHDTLLTLITLAQLPVVAPTVDSDELARLESAFRENRIWLDHLAKRLSGLPSRGTILDPAAWFIAQELGQHPLSPSDRVSPLGPAYPDLVRQVFDRSDERLAAAFLPEALMLAEFNSTPLWQDFLERAADNRGLRELLVALNEDWFDPWSAAEPPAPARQSPDAGVIERSVESLQVLSSSVLLPDPPDALRLKRLRFNLLTQLPGLEPGQVRTASHILQLASAVDGLYQQSYLAFIHSLLWVATDLLDWYASDSMAYSALPLLLSEFLPQLSGALARSFSEVDARFNANLAAAFDVVQDLHSGELGEQRKSVLQNELGDSIAQLALLVPEMAFYFDQPVRRKVSEEIDICISVAAALDAQGKPTLTREQFDGCLASMVSLATTHIRSAELAGDLNGPFGSEQMSRELELVPWQRINYSLGYLHQREPGACPLPERPLPNPLEWSALATLMTWFSQQVPVYLQTPENEALVVRMRQQGLGLVKELSRQVDCISGSGSGINDLVRQSIGQYRSALNALAGAIREAELEFRQSRLRPGADVVLGGETTQRTAYRTPDLTIGPCNPQQVCEMDQPLEATRALIGLFPDPYLLADQIGMGSVEICYDNLQWVDRRSELVRPEDPNVANFYGHLSFDLEGRYREGETVQQVFGSNFTSPDEYHYLFAAASDEVLQDGCPTEWVGTRIVTTRSKKRRFNVVPDRLTYLSAARTRPSDVINSNWTKGAEWRDWFVTGLGVTPLSFEQDPDLQDRLAQRMRALYLAEQQTIYSTMLRPPSRTVTSLQEPLYALLQDVAMYKGLLRSQLILFYPSLMLDSNEIRAAMEGQNGLLDDITLRRFEENGVAIGRIQEIGLARLQDFQSAWDREPEMLVRAGSVDVSVAHAIARLNSLFIEHFSAPRVIPPEPAETVTAIEPTSAAE